MGMIVDEDTVKVTDATITFNNAFDSSTGVATITITPKGGVATLPGLVQGESGPPGLFRDIHLEQHDYDSDLPDPAAYVKKIKDGGSGESALYDLYLNVNQGPPGDPGEFSLSKAGDVTGDARDKTILVYHDDDEQFHYQHQRVGDIHEASTVDSTQGNSGTRKLASVHVKARPFDWRPFVHGEVVVEGTDDTSVDLIATINSPDGDQCGYGRGLTGHDGKHVRQIQSSFGGDMASDYGKIKAGESTTIYFIAKQTASTSDEWKTDSSRDGSYFTVAEWALPKDS